MALKPAQMESLLALQSRRPLVESPGLISHHVSLPEAQKITRHLRGLEEERVELRIGMVHTYTSDLLNPWIDLHAAVQGYDCKTYHAPYGLNLLEAQAGSGLVEHDPRLTLLMLQRGDLHPRLAIPVAAVDAAERARLMQEAVDRLVMILGRFREHVAGKLVVSVLPELRAPGLGLFDAQAEQSEGGWWSALKTALSARLRDQLKATLLLDLDELLADVGREAFFDQRFWYTSKYPFGSVASFELARRLIALAVADRLPKAKVIALDADNTLWGGIIGEDGMAGIGLGNDYPGSAFVDFQRRLLDFQQRGLILAMCSKNNPEDVDEVLQNHPHQLLRDEHFAARRVNWEPKPQNLRAMAAELNLGLDSFVFVDDSDHECALVRSQLPEVTVVQVPARALDVPTCLDCIARLEVSSLTREDLAKTRMYAQERQRRELQAQFGDAVGGGVDDYLASLNMRMSLALDDAPHTARLAQLTQKTNQFNLTTRRYSEEQIAERIGSKDWVVGSFSLADDFGDSGVVGLAMWHLGDEQDAELDTLLMSCRVIGRKAELAFFEALLRELQRMGVRQLVADYIPTAKNRLVENFLLERGFVERPDGRLERSLETRPAAPESDFPVAVTLTSSQ